MRIFDRRRWAAGLFGLLVSTLVLPAGATAAPAFPGADGYGAGADGWAGGRLIAVTNLRDRGPGSLRRCMEAKGPRVCIFRVGGTIHLDTPLRPRSGVYVAGQTAPGDGVQLRMAGSLHGPLLIDGVRDVVVRFLKLRPGALAMRSANVDAVTIQNASRIYLGNLSLMFASDETVNVHVASGTARDITLADSIVAYSLDRANHPDGRHSKGALICSDEGTGNACGRVSLLRNVFAHHRDRNPDLKATALGPIEVVNNIFYDPISQMGEFYDLLGDTRIAYVGNLAMTGPSSIEDFPAAVEIFDWEDGHAIGLWAEDNIARDCRSGAPLPVLDPVAASHQLDKFRLRARPLAADDVLSVLPEGVGDVLPDGGHRDRLDRMVLDDLGACQGRVINDPEEVGGWPDIARGEPPQDRDGDLLPDLWEAANGLDPDTPDDPWADPDGDGRATVAVWLAELAGDS